MSKILIVDDEKSFLASLVDGLSEYEGFEIATAYTGKEALDRLQQESYEVVITDLKMPEMGGYELVNHMAANYSNVPVFVMTAFGTPEMEENLRVLGVTHYLEKPIDYQDLAEKVIGVLEEKGRTVKARPKGAKKVLEAIAETLASKKDGEIIVKSGKNSGHLFLTNGKIAWVMASTVKSTFFTYIQQETKLQFEELKAVFEECKRTGDNFGEKLIEWEMIDRDTLRGHLLDFASSSLGEIIGWPNASAEFSSNARVYKSELIFSLRELTDKLNINASIATAGKADTGTLPAKNKKEAAADIREILRELTFIDGFQAVVVFSDEGDVYGGIYKNSEKITATIKMANELMEASQRATEIMGVGRGNMVQITSEESEVFIHCFNENTDYAVIEKGKAHFHSMMILEKNSALGLARIQLEKAVPELADVLR